MTWVSAQLTQGRDRGEFDNYGERLYVEGLVELEKKKAVVSWPSCLGSKEWVALVPDALRIVSSILSFEFSERERERERVCVRERQR
jgi:hypothetical protein